MGMPRREASPRRELKNERVYVRFSERQRDVISTAADADHKDLSEFVRDAALTRAGRVLADRRMMAIPEDRWDAFLAALDRPVILPDEKPALTKLLTEPSILER